MARHPIIAEWSFVADQGQNKFVEDISDSCSLVERLLRIALIAKVELKIAVRGLVSEILPSGHFFIDNSYSE